MAWNGAPWPLWGCAPKTANMIDHKGHKGEIIAEKDGYYVIHCTTCILNHCMPLPSEEFLADYYSNKFYQIAKKDYVERYEKDRSWWMLHHNYTVQQALKLLENIEWPWVLDVGTGPGLFLDAAQQHGFRTYGVEPCADIAHDLAQRGHTVAAGTLRDFVGGRIPTNNRFPTQYSMVNAYEVLEHVPDPEGFLDVCRSLLIPGGVLSVVVPNDYNSLQMEAQKKLGISEWWLAPPEHLNYFNPKTLQLMVRRTGFKIFDIRTTFALEQFLLEGKNYIGNDAIGREIHGLRKNYEMNAHRMGAWEDLMEIYRDQCSDPYSGTIGREICLLAIKE